MSSTSTSALSSLEAMLVSLMRGSAGDENTAVDDDGLASLPPLPARPNPRGRRPSSPYTAVSRAAGTWTTTTVMPPSPSTREDTNTSTTTDDSLLLAELERKAAEVEARVRLKEEENAELRRRIERYHVEWLKCEIKIKSLEEACQEQMAALQAVQDAKAKTDETARDRRESLESLMKMSEEEPSARRLRRHGRDRAVGGGKRIAVTRRLGSEFRPSRPWQPAVPSANSVDDLEKLKARFSAWKKDYKARLRGAKAGLDVDRWHRGGCWI